LLEVSAVQLARAGDNVAGVFAFLAELGYSGFVMGPKGWLVPAEIHADNDFWFFHADDPLVTTLTVGALRPESIEKRAAHGRAC